MNTFEYVSVIHSVVLALGIARLLGGFAELVRYWRQLNTAWFFLGWLILLLSLHLGWWFGLWARFNAITSISLSTYVIWFMIPATLFIASRLLVPEFRRDALPDLEARFEELRVPFFCALAVLMLPDIPGLIAGTTPKNVWLIVAFSVLALSGALFRNKGWQKAVLGLMAVVYFTFLILARASVGI